MVTETIKSTIGDRARDIIVSDLGLTESGNLVSCPYPSHTDSNPSAEWKPYAFNCYSCGEQQYDIFTHYQLFHGLSFTETIEVLCQENGILNTFTNSKTKKIARVKLDNEYVKKSNSIQIMNGSNATEFFAKKNINEALARNIFYCRTSNNEIFLDGFEVVDNTWRSVFCKRRLLNMNNYIDEEINMDSKEIQIKGGTMCFFGLTTLYNSKGELKTKVFIVEGQLDAMRLATELEKYGQLENAGILSVPNGGASLATAWNNSPFFRRWVQKTGKKIILIPDADATGLKMLEQASEIFNNDILYWINLDKLPEVSYRDTKGDDISDVLDHYSVTLKQIIPLITHTPLRGLVYASDANHTHIEDGIQSGFFTHDYNDMGFKAGKVTILSGYRGQGKTTIARQFIMASAKKGHKNFCFFGESSVGDEIARFSRMVAKDNEIVQSMTREGRIKYTPSQSAIDRFKNNYGDKIVFFSKEDIDEKDNTFDVMMDYMKMSVKRGVKLFLIDNMMIISEAGNTNIFQEQKRIIQAIKDFSLATNTHVIVIAHPRAGEGVQKISGALEQENLVDTILYYIRMSPERVQAQQDTIKMPNHELSNISACLLNQKIRDEGTTNTAYLEWDSATGTVVEIVEQRYSKEADEIARKYKEQGFYSRMTQFVPSFSK